MPFHHRLYHRVSVVLSVLWILTVACNTVRSAHSKVGLVDTDREIQALLSAEEYVPTLKDIERLGDRTPHILMSVADDRTADPLHRSRALALLQFYPGRPIVSQFLRTFIEGNQSSLELFRSAIISYGSLKGGEAVATIVPYLSSEQAHTREAAAHALAATKDPEAAKVLESAAAQEKEEFLKQELHELSAKIRSAKTAPPELHEKSPTQVK